jgi:hypothetical protein
MFDNGYVLVFLFGVLIFTEIFKLYIIIYNQMP